MKLLPATVILALCPLLDLTAGTLTNVEMTWAASVSYANASYDFPDTPDAGTVAAPDFVFNDGLVHTWTVNDDAKVLMTQGGTRYRMTIGDATGNGDLTITSTSGTDNVLSCSGGSTPAALTLGTATTTGHLKIDGGITFQTGWCYGAPGNATLEIVNGKFEAFTNNATKHLNDIAITLGLSGSLWFEDTGSKAKDLASFQTFISGASLNAVGGTLKFENLVKRNKLGVVNPVNGTLVTVEPFVDPDLAISTTITLLNNGVAMPITIPFLNGGTTQPLTITAATPGGSDAAFFTMNTAFPLTVGPGAGGSLALSFNPAGGGLGLYTMELTIDSNDSTTPSTLVMVNVNVVDPIVSVPASASFGPYANGAPIQTLQIPVTNNGISNPLELLGATILSDPLGRFAVLTDFQGLPAIAPGGNANVAFSFDPTGLGGGRYSAEVQIDSSDGFHGPQTVMLTVTLDTPGNQLIAWWPLDSDGNDASGNGHHGLATGTVTYGSTGAISGTGNAANFTPNSKLTVPFNEKLNPSSFTLVAWAKPLTGSTNYRSVVSSRRDLAANGVFGFTLYKSSDNDYEFWSGGSKNGWDLTQENNQNVVFDGWTHLALTYDLATGTKKLYENGVEVASNTGVNINRNLINDFLIGAGADTGNNFYFNGDLDDIALFNYPLAPADITAIAASGLGTFTGITPGTPYTNWASGFSGFTNTDPAIDADGDGLSNALEYALGTNPTVMDVDTGSPRGTVDATDLILTYRRSDVAANDPNCAITPRYGSDLTGWTVAENGTNEVVISVDDNFHGVGIDQITVRIPRTLAGTTGRMFAQLKVTIAP